MGIVWWRIMSALFCTSLVFGIATHASEPKLAASSVLFFVCWGVADVLAAIQGRRP